MKLFVMCLLLGVFGACTQEKEATTNIIQSEDYVLIEFAAKLEEAEHSKSE